MDDNERELEAAFRSTVGEVLGGTAYLPPDSLVTDVVAVVGYVDMEGDHGWSLVRCGSPWAALGLLAMADAEIEGENG